MDNVIQQFIQKCNLYIVDVSKSSKIYDTRNDYQREYKNEYDMWLHNTDWKVLPTIIFVDGYPRVLTRKDNGGGCNLIQIHCCRRRTNIPSPVFYQVC